MVTKKKKSEQILNYDVAIISGAVVVIASLISEIATYFIMEALPKDMPVPQVVAKALVVVIFIILIAPIYFRVYKKAPHIFEED